MAVVVDYIARIGALYFVLRTLAQRIVPDIGFQWILLLALACQPLMVDVLFGNLVSYLLAAWVLSAVLAPQEPTAPRLLAAAASGVGTKELIATLAAVSEPRSGTRVV